jgi:acyl-CoA thioesterase-1
MIRLILIFTAFFNLNAFANETKPTVIVALGDSLTEGYGIEKEKAYPTLVEKKLNAAGFNVKVINAGISGSTTASAPSRLKWLLQSSPQILFLALGANDGLRGVDVNTTKKNLLDTIHLAKEHHIKVWLAGMKMPPNYGKKYTADFEKMFADVAKEEKVPFLPFLLEGVAAVPGLSQNDGVHPNVAGHEKLAELVFQFMKKNL